MNPHLGKRSGAWCHGVLATTWSSTLPKLWKMIIDFHRNKTSMNPLLVDDQLVVIAGIASNFLVPPYQRISGGMRTLMPLIIALIRACTS